MELKHRKNHVLPEICGDSPFILKYCMERSKYAAALHSKNKCFEFEYTHYKGFSTLW